MPGVYEGPDGAEVLASLMDILPGTFSVVVSPRLSASILAAHRLREALSPERLNVSGTNSAAVVELAHNGARVEFRVGNDATILRGVRVDGALWLNGATLHPLEELATGATIVLRGRSPR